MTRPPYPVRARNALLVPATMLLLACGSTTSPPGAQATSAPASAPAATIACLVTDSEILASVKQLNSGVLPAGARVSKSECVEDFVVVHLESDAGPAVALLRQNGSKYEALEMGGDLCGSPVVKQAPKEIKIRLNC